MSASASKTDNIGLHTSDATITAVAAEATLTFTEVDAAGVLANGGGFAIRSTKLQQVAISSDGEQSPTYSAVHKYYNGVSNIEYAGQAGLFDVAVYKITISVPAANAADVAAAGKDVLISIVTSQSATGVTGGDTDRLHGYLAASNQTSVENAAAYQAQTDQTTNTLRFNSSTKTAQNWEDGFDIGYVAVFFLGEDGDDGTSGLTGNVYVNAETVTHTN